MASVSNNLTAPIALPVKPIVVSASAKYESAFNVRNCAAVALLVASVAATFFALKSSYAIVCTAITVWCVFTAAMIAAHRLTEGIPFISRPIRQLYGIAMETNANFIAGLLFPLTLWKSYHKAAGNLAGRPILLVNGFLSFASTWHYHRNRLAKAGLGPVYTVNVGSGWSIRDYAKTLQDKIKEIQKETGRTDISLIGHSRGGVLCSYFATHKAKEIGANVTDVITIGSPHKGTPMACVVPTFDAIDMRPGSKLQKEIEQGIKNNPQIRFSYIGSEIDGTVPLNSALPDKNAERQFTVPDLGHVSLLFSSRINRKMIQWLKESTAEKTTVPTSPIPLSSEKVKPIDTITAPSEKKSEVWAIVSELGHFTMLFCFGMVRQTFQTAKDLLSQKS